MLARRAYAWRRLGAEALIADYAEDAVVESPRMYETGLLVPVGTLKAKPAT